MSTYRVKWENGVIALIKAESEEEAIEKIAEEFEIEDWGEYAIEDLTIQASNIILFGQN